MNRTKTVVAALAALVMAAFFTGCGDKNLVIEGPVLHGAKDRTKVPANLKIPNGIEEIRDNAFNRCKAVKTVTFPKTLKKIGNEAFSDCTYLESVTIPEGVTEIGESSFEYCDSLASVTILGSVTGGYRAFSSCTSLAKVTIGNGMTAIAPTMFAGSKALTSVTIPGSVTKIGNNAFNNCDSLESVTFQGTKAQWEAIEKEHYSKYDSIGTFAVQCTDGELPSQKW